MDAHPFATLGHVRILLVPVGPIRKATFDKWTALIRSFEHIRLDDIPPDPREDRGEFRASTLLFAILISLNVFQRVSCHPHYRRDIYIYLIRLTLHQNTTTLSPSLGPHPFPLL